MHARRIIHRDIKPENIFLSCDDSGRWQPKLIDFGLARAPAQEARLTARGYMVGTPDYMSPERIQGEDAAPQDDIWGLCVSLYELVTGSLPFVGPTDALLRDSLLRGTPRSILDHGVGDEELWAIVQRGLSRRAQRYPSASALGKALAGWLWKQGFLDDISGLSLRKSWIEDDDLRRLSSPRSSLVATARFDLPFRTSGVSLKATAAPADPDAPTQEAPVPEASPPDAPPQAATELEPAAPPVSNAPRPRAHSPVILVLAVVLVGAVAAVLYWAR
jgi:serine/threonine-protein kinase